MDHGRHGKSNPQYLRRPQPASSSSSSKVVMTHDATASPPEADIIDCNHSNNDDQSSLPAFRDNNVDGSPQDTSTEDVVGVTAADAKAGEITATATAGQRVDCNRNNLNKMYDDAGESSLSRTPPMVHRPQRRQHLLHAVSAEPGRDDDDDTAPPAFHSHHHHPQNYNQNYQSNHDYHHQYRQHWHEIQSPHPPLQRQLPQNPQQHCEHHHQTMQMPMQYPTQQQLHDGAHGGGMQQLQQEHQQQQQLQPPSCSTNRHPALLPPPRRLSQYHEFMPPLPPPPPPPTTTSPNHPEVTVMIPTIIDTTPTKSASARTATINANENVGDAGTLPTTTATPMGSTVAITNNHNNPQNNYEYGYDQRHYQSPEQYHQHQQQYHHRYERQCQQPQHHLQNYHPYHQQQQQQQQQSFHHSQTQSKMSSSSPWGSPYHPQQYPHNYYQHEHSSPSPRANTENKFSNEHSEQHHHAQQYMHHPSYPPVPQQQRPLLPPPPPPPLPPPVTAMLLSLVPTAAPLPSSYNYTPVSPEEILPVYRYTTDHQHKTWKDMIDLFHDFVKRHGHGDVELTDSSTKGSFSQEKGDFMMKNVDDEDEAQLVKKIDDRECQVIHYTDGKNDVKKEEKLRQVGIIPATANAKESDSFAANGSVNSADETTTSKGGASNDDEILQEENEDRNGVVDVGEDVEGEEGDLDDDRDLMLRSWIREVRWVIRAEGLDPEENCSYADARRKRMTGQNQQPRHHRCDSENITEDRLAQLKLIPHFPLLSTSFFVLNDGDDKDCGASGVGGGDANSNNSSRDQQQKQQRSAFQRWLGDLMHYRAKHEGDCNVPVKFPEYPGLGNFVNRQRSEYRKFIQGKGSSLTQSKIRLLDRVNFVWSVRGGGHASWGSRLLDLEAYHRVHGHTNVPKNYPPNPPLGYWVNEQRFQYKRLEMGKSSYMTPQKIEKLNALNFKWSLRVSNRSWEEWMCELRKYKEEHGHVNVPLKYEPNMALGSFVNNQRTRYRLYQSEKRGEGGQEQNRHPLSITEDKIRDLEDLGFVWNVRDGKTAWSTHFEELRAYRKRYGNCNVPENWPENPLLSKWVMKQRKLYKNCQLTEERAKLLKNFEL